MRWLLSWTLYWVGHALSRPMLWWDWCWLYPPYNHVMGLSDRIQGDGPGPWKDAQPEDA